MNSFPGTPTLSVELRALIEQRNILTTRSKSRVLNDLDKQISHQKESKEIELKSKAIDEIFSSEVSYLNQLELAMNFFRKPVMESKLNMPNALKAIFDNLESVYNVNGELLNQLRLHGEDVGSAFQKIAPFFKLYSVYAYDYRQGMATLQDLPKINPKLDAFIKRQESRPEVCSKLGSLLIAPIQRIPRYRLLLKELLSHTPTSHPHHQSILDALKEVEASTEHINTLVSEQENMQRIIELQKSLVGGRPTLVHPGRRLLKEGSLMKISRKGKKAHSRYFVLMSDVLMYCKSTSPPPGSLKCCCVLPLRKCSVQEKTMSDNLFIITCNNVQLSVYSEEPYSTQTWVKAIKQAIQKEDEGRQTLSRRGSTRPALRKKDLNSPSPDVSSPRKRKQIQDDIEDICLPFHSPWKRNKLNKESKLEAQSLLSKDSSSTVEGGHESKKGGYLNSFKKAISNFGHSLQKYWVPLYTGRSHLDSKTRPALTNSS